MTIRRGTHAESAVRVGSEAYGAIAHNAAREGLVNMHAGNLSSVQDVSKLLCAGPPSEHR